METGDIQFNQPYLEFLLTLADFSEADRILLTTGVIGVEDLPPEVQDRVVGVPLSETPASAMEQLESFDLVVVVPLFGRYSGVLKFPDSWNLPTASAQKHYEDAWLAWAIHATRPGGLILSLTSQGMLTSSLREPVRARIIDEGLEAVISLGTTFAPETTVSASLLKMQPGQTPYEIALIDLSEVAEDADWISIAEAIKSTQLEDIKAQDFWVTTVDRDSLLGQSRLNPYFYHPRFQRIEPPEGYTEVLLSDIAEIRGGRSLASVKSIEERAETGPSIPFVQVGNITSEGTLSVEWARSFPKTSEASSRAGFACPGDVLITVAGTLGKVCLVPDSYTDGLYYDTSIRRIRVDREVVDPDVVYEFLNSEVARAQAERYASGSVIPTISSADLGNTRVFLPNSKIKDTDVSEARAEEPQLPPKTFPQVVADMLENQVVEPLRSTETQQVRDWRSRTVASLRDIMQQIQKDHEPLDELVTREFPLPIALAYRRMIRAQHNPYEQVSRLVELYESLTQFFYYVLLSDYLRNPALQRAFRPDDAGVRKAYRRSSMYHRLQFIDGLLEEIRGRGAQDSDLQPFIPELLDVDLHDPLDRFRQLRNTDAHSAAGTRAAQEALLSENIPLVEDLLNEIRFLRDYPLCRVRGSYNRRGKVILTTEYFQGALYETDVREQEAPPTEDDQPKQVLADREHVVLLNSQFDWLDLHPFYQVITSEEYRYEAHLCFHKQITRDEQGEQQIFGESIQFRREFQLAGIEDLQRLTAAAKL